jgi:Exostosin family
VKLDPTTIRLPKATPGQQIVLFSDQHGLPPAAPAAILLLPWWTGEFVDKSEFRDMGRYERYLRQANQCFTYTSRLRDADYAVLPADWKHYSGTRAMSTALEFIQSVREGGKRLIAQFYADEESPVNIDADFLFRTSVCASRQRPNELAMPGFVGDPISRFRRGVLPVREKRKRPLVSFCGWASPARTAPPSAFHSGVRTSFEGIETEIKYELIYSFRTTALRHLMACESIDALVIPRDGYCAGVDRQRDISGLARVRKEYFESIFESDYVLCIRGKGNYSYRFYETLAAGRIPVFVNTDSPLPLPAVIDWRNHCVMLDHENIADVGDVVHAFHESLTASAFEELQRKNRSLWEQFLTPEKFFHAALQTASCSRET